MSVEKDFSELHDFIKKGKLDKVKEILKAYPDEKHFILNHKSAAAVALQNLKCNMYEFLITQNVFMTEKMEDIKSYISINYDGKVKEKLVNKIYKIHDEYSKKSVPEHVQSLMAKSKFVHDYDNDENFQILRMYSELNSIKELEVILRIVGTTRNLMIVFDPGRSSADHMAPFVEPLTEGLTCSSTNKIYVAALEWFTNDNKFRTLGTLIHELTHFAVKIVYKNNFKPYCGDDVDKNEKFEKILKTCESHKDKEDFIKFVYGCKPEEQHDELIVRVPHLLALYKVEPEKLSNCKEVFQSLFEFFDSFTLKDFQQELPRMMARVQVNESDGGVLNRLRKSETYLKTFKINFNETQNIQVIKSNCAALTLNAIYQSLKKDASFELDFMLVSHQDVDDVFDNILNAHSLLSRPKIIIDCEGQEKGELVQLITKLHDAKLTKRVILITDDSTPPDDEFKTLSVTSYHHAWCDFELEFQVKFSKRLTSFQGKSMRWEKILDKEAMELIKNIPENTMNDTKIVIGRDLEFPETRLFVERRFITSESEKLRGFLEYETEDFNIEYSLNDVFESSNQCQSILIYDEPGMGKSTQLKVMSKRLKQKFATSWVVFMDLKEYLTEYQNCKALSFEKKLQISTFFCQNILSLKDFEADVFTQLFNDDRVIFLFDSFDEICPNYKDFILSLLNGIKNQSKNKMWIATRPHFEADLRAVLKPRAFKLKPFTTENRRELATNLFKGKNLDENLLRERLNGLDKFFWSLERFISSNPLLLTLTIEVWEEEPDLDLVDLNIYKLYDKFTMSMVLKCMDKGHVAKTSVASCFVKPETIEFHQQKAFEVVDKHMTNSNMGRRNFDLRFKEVDEEFINNVIRIGLMYRENRQQSENLFFIHRTFADFFAAQFIVQNVFLENSRFKDEIVEEAMLIFVKILRSENQNGIRMVKLFLDQALGAKDIKFSSKLRENFTKNIVNWNQVNPHFMHTLMIAGCFNLMKVLSMQAFEHQNDYWEVKEAFFRNNIVMGAFFHIETMEVLLEFLKTCTEFIGTGAVKKMFLEKNIDKETIFRVAHRNRNPEAQDLAIKKAKSMLSPEEFKTLLITPNVYGASIFSGKHSLNNIKLICEELEEHLTEPDELKGFCLGEEEEDGRTPFGYAAAYNQKDAVEYLWNFVKKLFVDETERKNFLLQKSSDNFTIFHFAVSNFNDGAFEFIKSLYSETFTRIELKEIILGELEETSIFITSINPYGFYNDRKYNSDKVETTAVTVWLYIKELFEDDKLKLKELLQRKNSQGNTVLTIKSYEHMKSVELMKLFLDED